MLAFALHTPTRHLQAVLADEGVILFCPPGGDWSMKRPPAKELRAERIDMLPVGDGVRIRTTLDLAGLTAGGMPCEQSDATSLSLPVRFVVGNTRIEVIDPKRSIATQRSMERLESDHESTEAMTGAGPSPATLTRWFEALGSLNRWPTTSHDFYQSAASLVVDPIGMDGAYLLVRNPCERTWDIVAANLPQYEQGVWFDVRLLDCLENGTEAWFQPSSSSDQSDHPVAYTVAPWQNESGEIAGAVVGTRFLHNQNSRRGVRHLEARLIHTLAQTIGDIDTRRCREQESLRRRVLLEQAFSIDLANKIESEPEILEGQPREVTLLFADLRNASSLFYDEQSGISSVESFKLLRLVLDALTEEVLGRTGVVIDYYGDGLAAMWNAPFDQPDHVQRACDAALAMVAGIATISATWQAKLGRPLEIGVGIHTGSALVGDVGSQRKIKYGARGAAINLASRVEQATKVVGTSVLISEETEQRLTDNYQATRICRAKMAGVPEAQSLFAIRKREATANLGCDETLYAEALALYEANRFDPALRKLRLNATSELTGPAAFLEKKIRQSRDARRGRRQADQAMTQVDSVIDLGMPS